MNNLMNKKVGEIVAEDYRTAQIFKNHKIDFCCKGNRSIQEVAEKNNLDVDILLREIDEIQRQNYNDNTDFKSWQLDLLADYIEKKHHRYVEGRIPVLRQYLNKLCKVHGQRHPELLEITRHFNNSADELTMHMQKKESALFPWVRKMVKAEQQQELLEAPHFGTVQNLIARMRQEHDHEGERFTQIAALSDNYNLPADACNTYLVTFRLLEEFEDDLNNHIHLENNILFPKAEALENVIFANVH